VTVAIQYKMHYAFCMDLRDWRRAQRLSAEDLGARVGVAASTLVSYENGTRRPRADVAQRIEAVTGGAVSAASLLGLSEPRRGGLREDAESYVAAEEVTIHFTLSADQARLFESVGADVKAVVRAGAEKALKEAEAKAWAEANREAIEAANVWIEKHGTLAQQLGLI
jgi:transcriptional regulator with XRE-family HTH domain